MTQFPTLNQRKCASEKTPTSTPRLPEGSSAPDVQTELGAAVARHCDFEIASFHTPGHKSRALSCGLARLQERLLRMDLTELPGLDDLSDPQGPLAQVESRAAALWGAAETFISVGGASAGIIAAFTAVAARGRGVKVAVPRNLHRSVVHALIVTGLEPAWYEPVWESQWGIWGAVSERSVEQLLRDHDRLAALLVVSPTYGGALSDITAIALRCRDAGIPLIVDEAHGAHLLPGFALPPSAVPHADLTVHSLHKTLTGLTQTGLVHRRHDSLLDGNSVRAALNLVHSSSPSYPLMLSIEQTVALLETSAGALLPHMLDLSKRLREQFSNAAVGDLYCPNSGVDPAHVLLKPCCATARQLSDHLQEQRIFAETVLGSALLFMLGLGSLRSDIDVLLSAVSSFHERRRGHDCSPAVNAYIAPPPELEQVLTPRAAFLMPSEVVPVHEAVGRIAHECLAPCPPGIPVCIPGQRVHPEVMNIDSVRSLRVVKGI